MTNNMDKKKLLLIAIVFLLFCGAGIIFIIFTNFFSAQHYSSSNNLPITSIDFTTSLYPYLLDLGKFFLTILVGVFVASLTFSEKIVNIHSSSWWAKSLLILCWLFLLLSIVCDGVGLVFLTNWFANEKVEHSQQHMLMFQFSFYAFGLAGINFGLALTSMLTAGIISFIEVTKIDNQKKSTATVAVDSTDIENEYNGA
jgi:hypothetical protein